LSLAEGDLDAAATAFQRGLDAHPTAAAWSGLGFVQAHRGEFSAALRSFERALELDPDYPEALRHAGVAYLNLGQIERAVERLGRADALRPGSPDIERPLASARARLAGGAPSDADADFGEGVPEVPSASPVPYRPL